MIDAIGTIFVVIWLLVLLSFYSIVFLVLLGLAMLFTALQWEEIENV